MAISYAFSPIYSSILPLILIGVLVDMDKSFRLKTTIITYVCSWGVWSTQTTPCTLWARDFVSGNCILRIASEVPMGRDDACIRNWLILTTCCHSLVQKHGLTAHVPLQGFS
ncbi:hypothetical protein VFPPC_17879 [Pochonia chlamydosporia 170]|uniref:Uncharacterized protein n=1 Tax=Pochonia chlamydosporia 170 TaxID=1380566 RepID=A0A219AQ51_METCM|nr:hypothetical protein VFPPC_17879 [Pochonia chlamydosporia 170]OWT42928.1 hypothetical protein VFPPC_17879 [Pochonia chlamydosporia 170]